jgi:hypothetical protein
LWRRLKFHIASGMHSRATGGSGIRVTWAECELQQHPTGLDCFMGVINVLRCTLRRAAVKALLLYCQDRGSPTQQTVSIRRRGSQAPAHWFI